MLLPGFGRGVGLAGVACRAVVPGVPGFAPAPTAPDRSPFSLAGYLVLVRRVLAGQNLGDPRGQAHAFCNPAEVQLLTGDHPSVARAIGQATHPATSRQP